MPCEISLGMMSARLYRSGRYVAMRLTSSMYHRFHAPHDCRIESVTYVSGDAWNVDPIALRRVERLFCKNERAIIRARLPRTGQPFTLVPVAAILVASIRLSFLDSSLDLRESGQRGIPCDIELGKGTEMGWFQHGSTILLFVPARFAPVACLEEGKRIRVGEPLMRIPGGTRADT